MDLSILAQQSNASLLSIIQEKQALIRRLSYNESLGMLNPAGLHEAIRTLPEGRYTVIFADVDRLKVLNSATGSHCKTNRYLAAGLARRHGEIVGQLYGDEFIYILDEQTMRDGDSPDAFIAYIARQLAGQPLTISERYALAAAHGCSVEQARLSATFSAKSEVRAGDVMDAIEWLSSDVLRLKAERDEKVTI